MNYIRHLNGFFVRLAEDKRMSSYHISLYFALFQQWNEQRFAEQIIITRGEMMELSRLGSMNTYARCMKELDEWGYIVYIPSSNLHSGSRVTCIRFDTAGDTASDTVGNTATDTGIENDTAAYTATDTARNTGIKNDTATNTATDTARSTGISSDLKSDTARSTAGDTATDTGIENDTARDTARNTASDTPFINSLNKNKQEEKSVKRNPKENFDENEKREKPDKAENGKNLPNEKFQSPELPEVERFFEQNRFPQGEAQKFYTHYQSSGWKTGDMKKILSWQAVARKWIENTQSFRTDEREFNQIGASKFSVTVDKDYAEPL
jgi:hypothetical protein